MSIYDILRVICSFKKKIPAISHFVNWLENFTEWRLLSISSIPGWTFDDKCYLGGQKLVLTCPGVDIITPMHVYTIILCVICSFKNSPLFPIFVNWLENLTEWRLLSISSIPGWTFDDKCYLGGQKWRWTYPGGVILHRCLYGILWVSCSFNPNLPGLFCELKFLGGGGPLWPP